MSDLLPSSYAALLSGVNKTFRAIVTSFNITDFDFEPSRDPKERENNIIYIRS